MSKVRGSRMNHVLYRLVYLRGRYINRESEIDADARGTIAIIARGPHANDRDKKKFQSSRPITF